MPHLFWMLGVIFTVWAGWLDWRFRRIPNWLTVPAFAVGLGVHTIAGGWSGAKVALAGMALPLLLLLPVVLLRGLGAGDWKLMGALGALLGWAQILLVLLATILLAGLFAVVQLLRQKRAGTTLGNLWELARGFFVFGLVPHPTMNLDNPEATSVPFGVAAAIATVLCYGILALGSRAV
jgi:prepilin peptidase CpaA